ASQDGMNSMSDQDEILQLREQVARLQRQLKDQQLPVRSDLINNHELVQDLARYVDGICTEQNVRKKHRLAESDWERLGSDEAFIEAIKRERERRVRNGATARERAQQVFTKVPGKLDKILDDKDANPRHVVEASRELRAITAVGAEAQSPMERFSIVINLGADEVLRFNKPIAPGFNDDGSVIDGAATPMIEDDDGKSV